MGKQIFLYVTEEKDDDDDEEDEEEEEEEEKKKHQSCKITDRRNKILNSLSAVGKWPNKDRIS